MNNKSIQELTLRLSHALDQNYDVVNFEAVLSVISALEGATITKEQLEATRLAKYINHLRRRTKSEQLARRAKSLLKKWREMVGIQQQTTESLSNQNLPAVTSTPDHEMYQRSQVTSPNLGSIVIEQVGTNNTKKLGPGDSFRCISFNTALTHTTINQSTNYNHKRLGAVTGANLANLPIPTVPLNGNNKIQAQNSGIDSEKQPTSFENLLTGKYSGTGETTTGSVISASLCSSTSRKSNNRKERNSIQVFDGASTAANAIDLNQSISNAKFNRSSAQHYQVPLSQIAPIVIDIQDSNSDSELNGSTQTQRTPTAQSIDSPSFSTPRFKKSKKDNKRKEREIQPIMSSLSSSINATVANNTDELSSIEQKLTDEQNYSTFVPIVNEISRVVYPMTGISEILSLSNSSVSSMFPSSSAAATSAVDCSSVTNKHKLETCFGGDSESKTKSISKSDLTFAGKFKQYCTTSNVDLFPCEGKLNDITTTEVVLNDSSSLHLKPSSTVYSFLQFSTSGCNSNDSTSNSRISPCDIIDVVNQDNSQSKIIDELRQQHTKQKIISTQQTELKQKHKNKVDQILMPPTTNTNLRQFNNIVENRIATTSQLGIPKKRGRKKGSKGIDAIIAKESRLCSQMLTTTLGCKKVKTTKELYTEMQNRKLRISSTTSSPLMSNWLSQQQIPLCSRPSSSCSDISLHSPRTLDACSTNATVSTVATLSSSDKIACFNSAHGEIDVTDSETNTSGPSHYSATANSHIGRRLSTDSASNTELPAKDILIHTRQPLNIVSIDSLKEKIKELLLKLPPVPSMETIEWESIKDVIPCTCKVIQSKPTVDQHLNEEKYLADLIENEPPLSSKQLKTVYKSVKIKLTNHQREIGIDMSKSAQIIPSLSSKPIKSIFDLDFDDDEDPLHKIRAEASAAPALKMELDALEMKSDSALKQQFVCLDKSKDMLASTTELKLEQSIFTPQESYLQIPPPIICPTYSIEEDPKCEAKQRFELQTQKVTKFHIIALHNCYIPNVNGNWDNAETTAALAASITAKGITRTDIKEKHQTPIAIKAKSTIGNRWNNVVPQYGSLINEYIPKDLSHIIFTPNFVPKTNMKRDKPHSFLPFLGVAPRYMKLKRFLKSKKLIRAYKKRGSVDFTRVQCKNRNAKLSVKHILGAHSKKITNSTNNNDQIYVKCGLKREDQNMERANAETESQHGFISKKFSNKTIVNDSDLLFANAPSNNPLIKLVPDNKNRTNSIILPGITIDVLENINPEISVRKEKLNCDFNSQNLLTFAKLPRDKSIEHVPQSNLYANAVIYQSYENQNDQNVNNNSTNATPGSTSTAVVISTENPVSMLLSTEKQVENRRNSSCSNSSLRQTKNSINVKVRRRKLQEHQQKKKNILLTSAHMFKSIGKRSQQKFFETTVKNPRIIKTIKLALNGNVTSHVPFQVSSSSNSTEDDSSQFDENVLEEYNSGHQNCVRSYRKYFEDNNCDVNCDGNDHNVINNDENNDNDKSDGFIGACDEDFAYDADCRGVVARNNSAEPPGNNHIMLTIKKTPSKTNSPSNSLSSLSPAINSSQALATNEAKIVDSFSTNRENESIKKDHELEKPVVHTKRFAYTQTQKRNNLNKMENKIVEDVHISSTLKKRSDFPTFMIASECRRERRMKKSYKLSKYSCHECLKTNLNQNLHNQLFFPHELDSLGVREKTLNITSSSLSCVDETDCEYNVDTNSHCVEVNTEKHLQFLQSLRKKGSIFKNNMSVNAAAQYYRATLSSNSIISSTECSHESEDEIIENVFIGTRKKYKSYGVENSKKVREQHIRQKQRKHIQAGIKTSTKSVSISKKNLDGELKTMPDPLHSENKLPLENNGLLHSFNNIYMTPEQVEQYHSMSHYMSNDDYIAFIGRVAVSDIDLGDVVSIDNFKEKQQQEEHEYPNNKSEANCNFHNSHKKNSKLDSSSNNFTYFNNKSGSLIENEVSDASGDLYVHEKNEYKVTAKRIKSNTLLLVEEVPSSSKKLLIPHKEYGTGLRAVDEDVDDEDGNNCARIQQFKEWHQVLQLRSFNDELLTVMPYVVLE